MEHKVNYLKPVRYELMFGREASAALARNPVGYLPVGCLERHGDHLPLGLDVIKAHQICCLVAQAIGGLVFPPHYYAGIHKMPPERVQKFTGEWGNIYTDATAADSLADIIKQLEIAGVKALVLYSGHYPTCQKEMIENIAAEFNRGSGIAVVPFCEVDIIKGDHAGLSETSLMLYLDKSLVDMTRISEVNYRDHGWKDENSPEKASSAEGEAEVGQIIAHLKRSLEKHL